MALDPLTLAHYVVFDDIGRNADEEYALRVHDDESIEILAHALIASAERVKVLEAALREACCMAAEAGEGYPFGGWESENDRHFKRLAELRALLDGGK